MGRIGKAYELQLRTLLLRLRARKLQKGIAWLMRGGGDGASEFPRLLERRYGRLREQVERWEHRTQQSWARKTAPQRFVCDAGLGGLARWLRAAGYDALWWPDVDDPELLRRARSQGGVLLTTDSLMMERGILRDGLIPSMWLSPALTKLEQLQTVLGEYRLPLLESRCMHCGGELVPADKEQVQSRIPPRTRLWVDDYFLCGRCGKLYWRGTHWRRIRAELERRAGPSRCTPASPPLP